MMVKYIRTLILTILFLFAFGLTAHADEGRQSPSQVDPYYGSFTTEIPIAVPAYHGLEPGLKLVYNSSGTNGWAGVGWSLGGQSFIERASEGKGTPQYNGNDIYMLDGMELVPCTTQGGTHCTKIQNYTRIVRDAVNDRWYVYGTNGNMATYVPLYQTTKGIFRWALSSVEDPRGNRVTYGYWCDPGNDCYLDRIDYNGTMVKFYSELRPDPVTYAHGAGMASTRYRLKSIDVQVSGARARAYQLAYTSSASTSRSLLSTVQQFGTNATLDGSGTVIGGTALPPYSLGYSDGGSGWTAPYWSGPTPGTPVGNQCLTGDLNGDGKTDMWCYTGANGIWHVVLSTGSGWTSAYWNGPTPGGPVGDQCLTGDLDGDGKTDMWCYTGANGSWHVVLSTGSGWTSAYWNGPTLGGPVGNQCLTGDLNGDGKTDMWCFTGSTDGTWHVVLSTGSGWSGAFWVGPVPGSPVGTQCRAGDLNGDGKTDMWCNTGANGNWHIVISTGSSWSSSFWSGPTIAGPVGDQCLTGDLNGDGKTDMWCFTGSTAGYWNILLSTGSSWSSAFWVGPVPGSPVGTQCQAGDLNGDGMTDTWCFTGSTNGNWHVVLATGSGWNSRFWAGPGPGSVGDQCLSGDVNGDGKTDTWCYTGSNGNWHVAMAAGGPPDLLNWVSNGLGGTTSVQYKPSSEWVNTSMPEGLILQTVSAVTTSDGRGNSSTTSYQYQGGLWSYSERRFLGFRKVTGVLDAAGNYTETYYYQKEGSISKPEYTYYRDASGQIYSYSAYRYTENAAAPYTSLLTERWDYECNLSTTCRRILTQMAYDQYGNVIRVDEYGDYDVTGDERMTQRGYNPNTARYIVGLPAYENVYAGIGTAGTLVKQTLFEYDGGASYQVPPTVGNVTRKWAWNSQTGGYSGTTYAYDGWGNVVQETDPRGYSATTTYDPVYELYATRKCNGVGHCTSRTYDPVLGQVVSSTEANGGTTTSTYDVLGRMVKMTRPDGSAITYAYLDMGNPNLQRMRESQPDGTADGLWTEVYQDGLGRVYRTVKKGGLTKEIIYSGTSTQKWRESLWYGPGETPLYQNFAYDGAQRLRTVTNPDGTYSEIVYGNGWQAQFDELRNEKLVWKDAYGQVTQVRERQGSAYLYTTFAYDLLGNVVKVVDAAGNVSTFTYDSLGRKLSSCDVDMGCWSYSYDAGGLLLSQTDAKGQTVSYSYDGAGRLLTKQWPDATQATWYYDEAGYGNSTGRLTRVVYPSGSESHTYDVMGNETQNVRCVEASCQTVQRSYDALSRVTSITYPDSQVVAYTYDTTGRLASVGGYVTSMTWNPRGQLTAVTYANGTSATYTYDANRARLATAAVSGPGGSQLYQAGYSYDGASHVTGMTSSTNPLSNLTFTYDSLNRLTGVSGGQSLSYSYDALGNMTSNSAQGTYSYGDAAHKHAVTAAGTQAYSYDANGNMTAGGGRSLTWDYDNRLASVTMNGQTTTFGYAADGERIFKKAPQGTTYYFGTLAETVNGSLVKYYYAGPVLVAKQDSTGAYWYHQDHLGSVRLLTDGSGQKATSYDYAPYGQTVASSGSADNPYGFTGHATDPETGLIYMNARYYDPALGRFLSPDTVVPDPGNPQALNRYAYAYNNPVSNTDPTGHAPVVAAVVTIASVVMSSAPTWVVAVAAVGAATTVAGYALKDPVLSTIGSVMLGFSGGYAGMGGLSGGVLGAGVAGLTSPLSPLDPTLKQVVGWGYTLYGWIKTPDLPKSDPELGKGLRDVAQGYAQGNQEQLMQGVDQIAKATNMSADEVLTLVNEAHAMAGKYGMQALVHDLPPAVDFWGSGPQLQYAQLVADKLGISPMQAVLMNPTGGYTGPGSEFGMWGNIQRGPVAYHAAWHDADGMLFTYFGMGRGYAAFPHLGLSPGSPLSGHVVGIPWWTVHLSPIPLLNHLY